jgi:RNA polymerase sigma-70 factor (ECF subfamily)
MNSSTPFASFMREDRGRVLAALIARAGGDFQLAEDALSAALEQVLREGAPPNVRLGTWVHGVAKHRLVDAQRRIRMTDRHHATMVPAEEEAYELTEAEAVSDERLRLLFTCCHPALALDARVALALRTLGGLSTEEVARAFLVSGPTMAARLGRAKEKIRGAKIPYVVPAPADLPERLDAVLQVIYLVFNEGYASTHGATLQRRELCMEARRLGELLVALMPDAPTPKALLALMLLIDARRDARSDETGRELIVLEEQDRSRWNREDIAQGDALLRQALSEGPPSTWAIEAAIQAVHGRAARYDETDFSQIAALYDALVERCDTPVVRLNAAVARGWVQGADTGLRELATLEESLGETHMYWAARAEFLRRLGRRDEARAAYGRAIALAGNEAERRFLERRASE